MNTVLFGTVDDRLLIEHGADVNARARTKYSALLVAALYPNGGPAIDLLFSSGAQSKLPKGEGARCSAQPAWPSP